MAEWNVLAKARNDFADMLDGMSDEQLASPSLCDRWSAVEVAGHLVSLVESSPMALAAGMAKNRKDPDGFIATMGAQFGEKGGPAISKSLRANAAKKMRPFSEASMVADTAVHTQDIRRPLGLPGALDPAVLKMSLDHSVAEYAKKHDTVPRFVATDMEWSSGTGPEITGPGESLLMALNQRDVTGELEGPGVELLG